MVSRDGLLGAAGNSALKLLVLTAVQRTYWAECPEVANGLPDAEREIANAVSEYLVDVLYHPPWPSLIVTRGDILPINK